MACVASRAVGAEPHPGGRDGPSTAVGLTVVFRTLRQRRGEGRLAMNMARTSLIVPP